MIGELRQLAGRYRWRYKEDPDGSFADATGENLAKMLANALERERKLIALLEQCQKCKPEARKL